MCFSLEQNRKKMTYLLDSQKNGQKQLQGTTVAPSSYTIILEYEHQQLKYNSK